MKERILSPKKKIRSGVSLPHLKGTAEMETVRFIPEKVYIPMSQHIGVPCVPCVKKGDAVFVGTKIGDSEAFISAPVHSSVSGTVTDVYEKTVGGQKSTYVEIDSDGKMEEDSEKKTFEIKTAQDLSTAARNCGLVGLGGAGFPTHVKLSPPEDTVIDTLIVNAAECEPYITADYRECMENRQNVMDCIYLIKEKLNLKSVVVCVESNKPNAINALYSMVTDARDTDDTVKLMKLPTMYPQGAEKVLIYSATGRVLGRGKLPSDIGCIVMNITSLGALYHYITTGIPLVAKRITVDGTAVNEPKNLLVPIGTKISDILNFVGGVAEEADKIITGGPMMGQAVLSGDTVIEKRTNAVLVMKPKKEDLATNCIRCGRCASHCPMGLVPFKVETANRTGRTDDYKKLSVDLCMECGSCSFVCPAKRPLTQVMRIAKNDLRRKK